MIGSTYKDIHYKHEIKRSKNMWKIIRFLIGLLLIAILTPIALGVVVVSFSIVMVVLNVLMS